MEEHKENMQCKRKNEKRKTESLQQIQKRTQNLQNIPTEALKHVSIYVHLCTHRVLQGVFKSGK